MALPTILMPTYTPSRAARNTRATRQSRTRAGIGSSNILHSPTAPFDDDPKWKLFITTNSKICAWDYSGCEPIFTSSSRGIVAAKRARDGSVLAIADAQVVMLHQMKDGQDKSYRLKGTQRCRLMQYSHDSRHLFYTDSLHNSVQSYSLSENRVVDAAKSHPSPITSFAVSCDSNLILSTSANPPTVQIFNQMLATTISLVPSASSAPVVSCAFHPSRKQLFLLAFGNGVLAAFDYAKLPIAKNQNKKENAGFAMIQCHARGIHAFRHLHDPSIAGSSGITGAGFVPGQRSRAVTVGEDGRCFLVDFEKGDTIGSWHIGAPGTGLTIREIVAGPNSKKEELGGYLIGVGTIHGKCLVYDGNGNKIAERVIDAAAESVLDVEWVFGDVSLPDSDMLSPPEPVSAMSSPRKLSSVERSAKADRSRIHSDKLANPLSVQNPNPAALPPAVVEPEDDGDSIVDKEPVHLRRRHRVFSPPIYDALEEAADQSYMKLFSPVKRRRAFKSASLPEKKIDNSNKSSDPRVRATQQGSDHRSAISAPLLWEDKVPEDEAGNEGQEDALAVAVENGFGAFQTDTQRETTTAEVTNLHSNNESVFEGLSSVPGDQVKVEERIEDGRILSEIKSIHAMFSGKSKSSSDNLPLLAPYLPAKARSTPISRVGPAPMEDSSIKRATSVPEGKIYPLDLYMSKESSQKSDNHSVTATARNGFEETESMVKEETQQPHREEQEDVPTEEDEDIWLAQTVSSRSSRSKRKRKKAAVEDETITSNVFPEVGTDLSRSTSTTRSSKSRKTVSWSDEPHPPVDIFPTPIGSSVIAEWGDGDASASSHSYLGSTRPLSITSHHRINSTRVVTTTPTGIVLDLKKTTTQNNHQTIEQIVKTALENMQAAMSQQMNAMQTEMQRQFRGQNREFQKLRDEMGRVREENQKLRSMLFKSSGVRDSVRKSGGPSSTPR
ncbi:WD40 repeat-like protein [Wilcoxina mikolae CBS 423.85]|nr:WD40 repeat-like protein [Wilcoxina mikolae CBS 423.85]